jgi:hypothetical protein
MLSSRIYKVQYQYKSSKSTPMFRGYSSSWINWELAETPVPCEKLCAHCSVNDDAVYVAYSTMTRLRHSHDLTETTREMVKRGTDDLKRLATIGNTLVCVFNSPYVNLGFDFSKRQPQHKTAVQKTSHDMQLSLVAFQRAQKVSAERQRTVVEDTKRVIDEETAIAAHA